MSTVQTVGKVIERVYEADGLSIACQVCAYFVFRLSLAKIGLRTARRLGKLFLMSTSI
jgi:hypothetical protein